MTLTDHTTWSYRWEAFKLAVSEWLWSFHPRRNRNRYCEKCGEMHACDDQHQCSGRR